MSSVSRLLFIFSYFFVLMSVRSAHGQSISNDSQATEPRTEEAPSFAVLNRAIFEALFTDGDLTQGKFQATVIRRGDADAAIDVSNVNLSLRSLDSNLGPLAWGTTRNQRRFLICERGIETISGKWSSHGQMFNETCVMECSFPPALRTEVILDVPVDLEVFASKGILSREASNREVPMQRCRIELGRDNRVVLRFSPKLKPDRSGVKIETDVVHVARRDEIFVQTDFSIEGIQEHSKEAIDVSIPRNFDIHSVAINGIPILVESDATHPQRIRLNLSSLTQRGRSVLRVQGRQPVRWVRRHAFPELRVLDAFETRRSAVLRIEAPLELHEFSLTDYVQIDLNSENRGEIWKFDATSHHPQIQAELGFPERIVSSDVEAVHFFDGPVLLAAARLRIRTNDVGLFTAEVLLPDEWIINSVVAENQRSEISSWSVQGRRLQLNFKSPISSSEKIIEINAIMDTIQTGVERSLPIPQVLNARTNSISSHWLLPPGLDVEISDNSLWNVSDQRPDFSNFHTISAELQLTNNLANRTFTLKNSNAKTLPNYQWIKIGTASNELSDEAMTRDSVSEPERVNIDADKLSAFLTLNTLAAFTTNAEQPKLVHHAEIQFQNKLSLKHLTFSLSQQCVISAITVDGRPVNVRRLGDSIIFPEDESVIQELTVIYKSTGQSSWFRQQNNVPIPRLNVEFTKFDWTLEIPRQYELAELKLADDIERMRKRRFLFGPLSQDASNIEKISRTPISQFTSDAFIKKIQRHYHSPRVGNVVRFDCWNILLARNCAWIAFLACMAIGGFGRLALPQTTRSVFPFWLFALLCCQIWLTNEWSMLGGAMLAGSITSLLIPGSLLQIKIPQNLETSSPAKLSGATIAIWLLFTSLLHAQQTPAPGITSTTKEIPFLVRNARYEQLSTHPRPEFRASLEVLIPADSSTTMVELPFVGTVFQSAGECFVDGEPSMLIPISNGEGVLLQIENSATDLDLPDANPWKRHNVQFDFLIRNPPPMLTTQPRIPIILDSLLEIPGRANMNKVGRLGQILPTHDESSLISLGPVGQLANNSSLEAIQNSGMTSYALLNVSPLGLSGELYLAAGASIPSRFIEVRIPINAVVNDVLGPSVDYWFISESSKPARSLVIAVVPDPTNFAAIVEFSQPVQASIENLVTISELPVLTGIRQQVVGIKTPINFSVTHSEGLAASDIIVDDTLWPENDFSGRTRPDQVLKCDVDSQLQLQLERSFPTTSHSIVEELITDQTEIYWRAKVLVDVSVLPRFTYDFQLTGGIRIQSAEIIRAGERAPLRFHQSGEKFTCFVPNARLGESEIEFQGKTTIRPETFIETPEIFLEDSTLNTSSLTLFDKTNWDVEWKLSDGTSELKESIAPDQFVELREVASFLHTTQRRPQELRLRPPPTVNQATIASRIQVNRSGDWNLMHLIHFSPQKTPSKQIQLFLPESLKQARIRTEPKRLKISRTEHTEGMNVTVFLPQQFRAGVSVQVLSQLSDLPPAQDAFPISRDEVLTVPQVQVQSAEIDSQLVFLNENPTVVMHPVNSVEIEVDRIPSWIPEQWKEGVFTSELSVYKQLQTDKGIKLIQQPLVLPEGKSQAQYSESIVWAKSEQASNLYSGISRLWMTGQGVLQVDLKLAPHISIEHVYSAQLGECDFSINEQICRISLPLTEAVTPVDVHWTQVVQQNEEFHFPFEQKTAESQTHLIGLMTIGDSNVSLDDSAELERIEVLLTRWEQLQTIVKKLAVLGSFDSLIQQELRQCRNAVSVIATASVLPIEQSKKIRELEAEWEEIASSTTIAADPIAELKPHTKYSFSDFLNSNEAYESFRWTTSNALAGTKFEVTSQSQLSWIAPVVSGVLVLLIGTFLYWKRHWITLVFQFSERRQILSLGLWGIFWMFIFDPPVIGVSITIIAILLALRKSIEKYFRVSIDG